MRTTTARVIVGDAREAVKRLEPESIDCIVTSPPYWMQRDYGDPNQIGLEREIESYVFSLQTVFLPLLQALKSTGTLFLNLGSIHNTYNGLASERSTEGFKRISSRRPKVGKGYGLTHRGLKPKSLIPLPWHVGLGLQKSGWLLRSEIIWKKQNPAPEPRVEDRPQRGHETILLFSKREKYFWEGSCPTDVWELKTNGPGDHPAAFPLELAVRCLEHGCPEGGVVLDPFCGSGTTLLAASYLGFDSIGFELNERFASLAKIRLAGDFFINVDAEAVPC